MEPVLTANGVLIPDREFMERVREACRERGTLFVMDEVSSGFGRTGRLFATEHFGVEPDVLCLGKSITGGYAPMAAAVTTRDGGPWAERVTVYRTARRLMDGFVRIP